MELNESEKKQVLDMIETHVRRVIETVRATDPMKPEEEQNSFNVAVGGLMRETAMLFAGIGARVRYVTMTSLKSELPGEVN